MAVSSKASSDTIRYFSQRKQGNVLHFYVFININVVLSVQDIRKLTKEKLSETRVSSV